MGSVSFIDGCDGTTLADARADCCGVHREIAEVVECALNADDAGLSEFDLESLQEAIDALAFCEKYGCERHYSCRAAKDALHHAYAREDERLAELDEREGPACCGGSGCVECLGGGPEVSFR